ncbi:DUF1289 domain-containing protein [Sphingomonas sp. JC676]|uniref:DUF1289 domain-containing protein n=1 Tax=Sphingomonas sp. JC676 TaxID=2768065 RepID=UPI0016580AE1|nr:DUF1289 domain-containing protein [Sphingomonas sp. JC676]MBC9034904.1 DUF1289 domain-containing protein [Sphingomonas sp. JC676]
MGELSGERRIPSPCTNVCVLDHTTGWCRGCGRTIDEITRWGNVDTADRAAVVAALPERMRKLAGL